MIYLESASTDPYYNLALEQVVFDLLPREHEYFMLWQNDNAIIIGRHQNTAEEINAAFVKEHGIRVARRLSGGGAVYHDLGNLNFTFVHDARDGSPLDLAAFCLPVVRALAELGVRAEISGRNDITIGGRKISGNAQYRKHGRVLHHGTILFDSDLDGVSEALRASGDKIVSKGIKSVRSRVTNVREHLPHDLDMAGFKAQLKHHMVEAHHLPAYQLSPDEEAAVEELRRTRYATWEWNYGQSPAFSLRKQRYLEGCGTVQIHLDVEHGRISRFAATGDYFGAEDSSAVGAALAGCELEEGALHRRLAVIDVGHYFLGLDRERLIQIILQ